MKWKNAMKEKPYKLGKTGLFWAYSKKQDSVFLAYGNEYGYFSQLGEGVIFSYWMPLEQPEPPTPSSQTQTE